MAGNENKPKRGGTRTGAGRKAKLKNPVNKLVRLEKEMVDAIEAKNQEVSTFLREAGERRLEEGW